MECKKKISFSILGMLGLAVISTVLVGILVLVLRSLDFYQIAFLIVMLIIVLISIIKRWSGALLKAPSSHMGVFAGAWSVGGILFVLWFVIRYFSGVSVVTQCSCVNCGHKHIKQIQEE